MGAPHHAAEVPERMLERISAGEKMLDLEVETGLPRSTLSRWWCEAGRLGPMSPSDKTDERFTSKEKVRILQTSATLSDSELGAYLRREAGVDQLARRAMASWRSEKAQAIYATIARDEMKAAGAKVVELVKGKS